jgi:hypothetical protein
MSINTVLPNFTLNSTDQYLAIWKNTRVMKSAGWLYKSSADGTNTKDTTGNPVLDYWGPGGIVAGHVQLGSQTGAAAVVSAVSATIVTLTGLTGMTATSVGHSLTISGAVNASNNGTFTIVNFVSSSSVKIYNGNLGVTEGTSLTWSERVSGSATITWSAVVNGREQTITGLSGMTASSAGHQIYLQGSSNANNNGYFNILSFVSSSSVVIINTTAGAGSNTNAGQWTELDPFLDVYPVSFQSNNGSGCWINMQGPSTLKIPISAAATGTFIRGENLTQSVSSAQGELLGYQFDPVSNTGFLVVMPRVNGTGAGVRGWQTTGATVITGASSAATVPTVTSTPVEFVREMVFWKGSSTQLTGTWYYQCVDQAAESAARFSVLAGSTGCTATIAPAGGGTNNAFPVPGTFAARGNGGSQSATTWIWSSTGVNVGKLQCMAVNADYTTGSSADGTWTLAIGYPAQGPGSFVGVGFYRVDNNEDGDVDPYVLFVSNNNSSYFINRTGSMSPTNTDHFSCNNNNSVTWFCGFRRRGFTTGDGFQQFNAATLAPVGTSQTNFVYNFTSDNDSIATSISTTPQRIRDPIWVISNQTTQNVANQAFGKMRKGTIRWGFMLAGGNGGDTYDGRRWIQLSSSNGSWVMGPWDGLTSPLQT